MAGIGFQLQKLFREDYYSSRIKAYGFAVFVTSGPWLLIILSISLSKWFLKLLVISNQDITDLLTISLAYAFIFSQVVFSLQQLTVTRFMADSLYHKQYDKVYSSFLGMSTTHIWLSLPFAVFLILYSPMPLYYELELILFYLIMGLIWVAFLYISALKDYRMVSYSFLWGGVVVVLGTYLLTVIVPFENLKLFESGAILLLPFILGMSITLTMLFIALNRSFKFRGKKDRLDYYSYFDRLPRFVGIGFLYSAGLWVANWFIWWGEGSEELYGFFRYHMVYDTAVFWSYLSIVPTLMFFVISVETRFYPRYRSFYGYINQGGTLKQIQRSHQRMIHVLKEELYRLLRNQGLVTFLILLFSSLIASGLKADPTFLRIFRLTLLGAFCNGMVLVFQLLLLYFEDHKGALRTSILFFGSILILTYFMLPFGSEAYGLSFALGSLFAFIYAALRLMRYVEKLDFYAFSPSSSQGEGKFFHRVAIVFSRIHSK
ncbi:exopolysaccharide Pel transporter PelG [Bacillus sp. 2205SS5-2]|uniref:exopolysaccharide Pel transporter PelG n=1 Tax=Bacillus sp. 2205SS5-2 TaxID=3109031 RepID=UPI003004E7D5